IHFLVPFGGFPNLRRPLDAVYHRILGADGMEKNQPDGVGIIFRLPLDFLGSQAVQRPVKRPFGQIQSGFDDVLNFHCKNPPFSRGNIISSANILLLQDDNFKRIRLCDILRIIIVYRGINSGRLIKSLRRLHMAKIVLIGAGSHVFSRHLITDILTYPELRDGTISLMDVSQEPLDLITGFAKKLVLQNGFKTKIQSTTRRREALEGADYVFVTIQVGGSKATWPDRELPRKYGVDQAVGDTTGVGGVFYGARHVPVILDICRDMEELCPDAWLLNYTNPMSIICWAVNDYTHIKNVGLCHSVQGTAAELAKYMGIPIDELDYWVAGINHMAWFLKLKHHGEDVYPLLKKKFKDPALYSA